MASSLARQLAQIAASSKSSLNIKAQKAAHSKSLIWEPAVAASQTYQTLYATCRQGFDDLCQLDARFAVFAATLFGEQSQDEDRGQMTAAENAELDRLVEAFLRLVGSRLRLMPAIKAVEWLIRRFRIHESNTNALITTFLPYHALPAFVTLLSILPAKLPAEYLFLSPYVRALASPPRSAIVHQAIHHTSFLTFFSDYTLESCRALQHYPGLISFWAGVMTEAVNGLLDKMRSGRHAIQHANDQALLHIIGPILARALALKKVPNLQIAAYMAMAVFVAKGSLEDTVISAFMEQLVHGWTIETARPGLVSLAILAQYRSAKQISAKVTKALLKIPDIGRLIVDVGRDQRVDKLANGFCLSLVERLIKRADGRGLPIITTVLSSQTLHEKQVAVLLKALLVAAHHLTDESDKDGSLRKQLGITLTAIIDADSSESAVILKRVLDQEGFDIEELEMKLDASMRPALAPLAIRASGKEEDNAADAGTTVAVITATPETVGLALDALFGAAATPTGDKKSLASHISADPGSAFEELARVFVSIIALGQQPAQTELLKRFVQISYLQSAKAFDDCTFFAFFIRIWCGPFPALARAAALHVAKERLVTDDAAGKDVQILIPYCLAALSDRSKRVRRNAVDLAAVLANLYDNHASIAKSKSGLAATRTVYGTAGSGDVAWLSAQVISQLLKSLLLPAGEECVLYEGHISTALPSWINGDKQASAAESSSSKASRLSKDTRLQLVTFLATHLCRSPLLTVQERLLTGLNEVTRAPGITRTQLLLPVLKSWAEGTLAQEASVRCIAERVNELAVDQRFVDVVVANDQAGVLYLCHILRQMSAATTTTTSTTTTTVASGRSNLIAVVGGRLRTLWPAMKTDTQALAAQELLETAHASSGDGDVAASEAADVLQKVELTSGILAHFLDGIQAAGARTMMLTEAPPNKRRRTSASEANRGQASATAAQLDPELAATLRRATFVLQLVESSDPAKHAELFDSLFSTLSELHHFRTVVGSELGYLQNLVLRSLLAMMPVYQANKSLKIDSSAGHGDLLVSCIQKSSSPVVQNAALLLIASLATTTPDLVLHSVMPIFTFMGTSVLRQNDDYSAHVVNQTIKEVVPPLIASLRKGKRNPISGASELLVSFTTAYEHVPAHRRQGLFASLVETLGADEFLFAVVSMLIDRYGADNVIVHFCTDLMSRFGVETQLESLLKQLLLVKDVFAPRPDLSEVLLGHHDDHDKFSRDSAKIAGRQLAALPTLLGSKTLRSQFSRLGQRDDDMEAAKLRELYSNLLENVLVLADSLKADKTLHKHCGSILASLLNLLSIGEFVKAVEDLLHRPSVALRQKVLRALELRVERESHADPRSQVALLGFLPQLTAAIRESADIKYKHIAVSCVDKIAEKYGRRDVETVTAAATTIASVHCLGHADKRLRVMALLCLASLADVLQDAMVPVLPIVVPQALLYLRSSLDCIEVGAKPDDELHSASYAVMTALAQHLPYMMSGYLDQLVATSVLSTETPALGEDAKASRLSCVKFYAEQLEAKDILGALDRKWPAAAVGKIPVTSLAEMFEILNYAVDKKSKASVAKNVSSLLSIYTKTLDMRRVVFNNDPAVFDAAADESLKTIEQLCSDVMLKMIYKLNDASFRPVFTQLVEWMTTPPASADPAGLVHRRLAVYSFLATFFDNLKSIVTGYATYILDDVARTLRDPAVTAASPAHHQLWLLTQQLLAKCFAHDQDDFWRAPAHFGVIAPALTEQLARALPGPDPAAPEADLIAALVELAGVTVDSHAHRKEINAALLKHLRADRAGVRLAAVRCEQALTERLGEEWLADLPEMLPYIGELQDDDDPVVERETHRWIVKIEDVLGESLDSMLQ